MDSFDTIVSGSFSDDSLRGCRIRLGLVRFVIRSYYTKIFRSISFIN